MDDMAKVIIPKSDQWNFDDFQAGPLTFTIKAVRVKAGQEQPVEMMLEGTLKFYRPCKSMARIFVAAWGADSSKYVGRSVTLYGDPTVRWGGLEVGGIRVSHMSDIESKITMALTATKQSRKPYTVQPLKAATKQPAAAQTKGDLTLSGATNPAEQSAPAADPTTGMLNIGGKSYGPSTISPDEAIALEARCTENNIKVATVKKFYGVELFGQLTPAQLIAAHEMITVTLAKRMEAQ